ncbi:MAG TPA: MFS transporter [Syntrophorhabdaceae bacterium]|nr:MFS transporter [Syntrophorhabdaceae bacterium]HQK45417.1 MFS transporter [Syntrophorhabdaceae bacterium]
MTVEGKQENKGIHWAWIVLAVCFIDLYINYGIRLGYSVLLPEMIRTMGFTRRQGGDIFNAYFIVYILFSLFTGYLTDRLGARKVISIFCIILGIGTVLMGTANSFWQACIFYGIVGMGGAAMWTPIITLVQRWFAVRKKGMALGILSTGFGLGFATMGRFYPAIVAWRDWRYCWYILGIAALFMVIVNALLLRSKPEDKGLAPWGTIEGENTRQKGTASIKTQKISFSEMLSIPNFWFIGFSYLLIAASLYLLLTFMVDYARYELGLPYARASLLATIHGTGQIVGVLTIPMASDYIGRRMTLILSNACIGLSVLSIILAGPNVVWLYVSIGFLGAFFGATFPMYGAAGGDYFKKEMMGTVIGALTIFYGSGAILANRMGGHIRDITGSFFIPFIIAFISAIVASVLMIFVKKRPTMQI